MAKLSGLKIQKLLPKTNCKECGSNTCLAFAMKLASKKADLSDCPYASDEAKKILGAASEPPVKPITIGKDKNIKIGDETVLYRHDKTFANQTLLAVNINDTDSTETVDFVLKQVKDYKLDKVGKILEIEMVSVTQKGSDRAAFVALVEKAYKVAEKPLVIKSADVNSLVEAAKVVKDSGSVLSAATSASADILQKVAQENGLNLAVSGTDINELVKTTEAIKKSGFNELVLQFNVNSLAARFQINTIARRAAIKDNYKPLGYPSIAFLETTDSFLDDAALAITEVCKYGGICVLPYFEPALLNAIMTLRLNVYTDPQQPIQVEPGIYPVGEPDKNSAVFVTTNFSLTYFIVSGEIENSGINAWLVIPECEGMSVLTAWAAGKFSGSYIAKAAKEMGLNEKVDTRNIIIPGYVAGISGELEESLGGWKCIIGPQEASDLESFVKAKLS